MVELMSIVGLILCFQNNANVNAEMHYCRWTPLHKAAACGAVDCVNVRPCNLMSLQSNNGVFWQLLLAFGADPWRRKSDGATALVLNSGV